MEQYLRRKRLAAWADGLGMTAAIYFAAALCFVWLWGLGPPALLAGAALGTMLMMARSCLRRSRVARREQALRRRLGAEMLLEELLLEEADAAHRKAAELLASRWPLGQMEDTADGVLCRQGEEKLLILYLRMAAEASLSQGDLIAAQRAVRRQGAERGVVCVPGRTPPQILARAEETAVPLRIIRRETLLALAGRMYPATDAQLVALGQRRRSLMRGGVLALVFLRDKARRYHAYGLMMTILYLLAGLRIYAVAGLTCLAMAVMCRTGRSGGEAL